MEQNYLLEILAENLARRMDIKRSNESKRSQQQQQQLSSSLAMHN